MLKNIFGKMTLFSVIASSLLVVGFLATTTDAEAAGTTYYVRSGGGTSTQCTGTTNADYPGSGTGQACAFSHSFYAFPPGGSSVLSGGDTLIIADGSYKMGYGAPNDGMCSSSYPWDCYMPVIPSGPSSSQPTRILGENYNSGCSTMPELYGVERTHQVFDLDGSDNVELQCLEVTDNSSCVEFHSGSYTCNRSSYPYGEWASTGIYAEDSENVLLKNLNVHGLASTGIHAGRLTDWTIEDTDISYNGWVGWDGDISSTDSDSGDMIFRRVGVNYNGCGQDSGGNPVGCWGQSAGGYGDGLGTGDTGGNWVFEDSTFLYNTSDGLDLLYHRLGGSITVRRTHAEGNAGQQIKTAGSDIALTNNVIVGNCGYFDGQSFEYDVDHCRALGTALAVTGTSSSNSITMYNNSLYSEGDCIMTADNYSGGANTLKSRNNIFVGDTDYHQPFENSCLLWNDDSNGSTTFDNEYSTVYNAKEGAPYTCSGSTNLCSVNPLYTQASTSSDSFNLKLQSSSPAINTGTSTGAPNHDFYSYARPYGSGHDMGAYEYGALATENNPDDGETDDDEDDSNDTNDTNDTDDNSTDTDNDTTDTDSDTNTNTNTDSDPIRTIPGRANSTAIVTGAGYSGGPHVRVFAPSGSGVYAIPHNLFAYDSHVRSGVKIATGDLDGDGIDEIVTGTGSGGGPHIRVFDKNGDPKLTPGFFAYAEHFRGGVNVACGDLDGDGKDEIIAGAGNGGGPHIRVFDGEGNAKLTPGFFAYGENFRGGVNVASGDIDNDGQDEIIAGAGVGGGPQIRVFEGNGQVKPIQFFAFHPDNRSGISVASADFDGDGKDEIVAGQLTNEEAWVKVYRYNNQKTVLANFRAYGEGVETGVNVAAADIDNDNIAEIITGPNYGGGPQIRTFELDTTSISSFFSYTESFRGGSYVAVGEF